MSWKQEWLDERALRIKDGERIATLKGENERLKTMLRTCRLTVGGGKYGCEILEAEERG